MRIIRMFDPDKIEIHLSEGEFSDLQELVSVGYDVTYGRQADRLESVHNQIYFAEV